MRILDFNSFINESIRDLMQPKSEEEILKSIDNLSPEELLKKSCSIGYLNGIKLALEKGVDPSVNNNYAIEIAAINGHTEIVKLLLTDERVDPSDENNFAIIYASENGHTEIVKLLLNDKRVDPSANNNYAIIYASENGHIDIVRLLLTDERVDSSAYDNSAIRYASENGYIDIVKLLLQDKRVRDKLTDEEIEKYENQIKGLNESIRDLMKPKTGDEIKKLTDEFSSNGKLLFGVENNLPWLVKDALKNNAEINQNVHIIIPEEKEICYSFLEFASIHGYLEIVKILIKYGACENINDLEVSIKKANKYNHIEIYNMLKKYKKFTKHLR